MATDSVVRSCTNTLTTTVADTITITQAWPAIEVTNHSASANLYVRMDGTTAVGAADNTEVILPVSSKVLKSTINVDPTTGASSTVISVVGSANVYTIDGVA